MKRLRLFLLVWFGGLAVLFAVMLRYGDPFTCAHPALRTDGPVVW